jgi:hypothetical protein
MIELWQNLAVAVGSRIEFERRCNRSRLLDESAVVRFGAEYLQSQWNGEIRVGEPHQDLAGKFVDLVGTRPLAETFGLVLEGKWLKDDGGDREWLKEIVVDLFRLQHLTTNTAQGAERILLVAGTRKMMRDHILRRKVHSDVGHSVRAMPHVLPERANDALTRFQIRNADANARRWLRKCHEKLGCNLPSTYNATLAGHYRTWRSGMANRRPQPPLG